MGPGGYVTSNMAGLAVAALAILDTFASDDYACAPPDDEPDKPPPWPRPMAKNFFALISRCAQRPFSLAWERPKRPKEPGPG